MVNLQQEFKNSIVENLKEQLKLKNPLAVPRLLKIVVNMGVGSATSDKKHLEKMGQALSAITGQKPKVTRAKKSIASFKLRQGEAIGLVVTLRGSRMYDFLDKLNKVVMPRLKDFGGVSRKSFDKGGNYTLGLTEYAVFPEIDPASVERIQGFEIAFVTSARNQREGLLLLEALGVPFEKEGKSLV